MQQWLDFALSPVSLLTFVFILVISLLVQFSQAARHPMLLLVGPPGCGKTTTVHTLANEMGCAILEWVNPVTNVGGSEAGALYTKWIFMSSAVC